MCKNVGSQRIGHLNNCVHVAYNLRTVLSRAFSGPKYKAQLLVEYVICCNIYSIVLYWSFFSSSLWYAMPIVVYLENLMSLVDIFSFENSTFLVPRTLRNVYLSYPERYKKLIQWMPIYLSCGLNKKRSVYALSKLHPLSFLPWRWPLSRIVFYHSHGFIHTFTIYS